MKEKLEALHKLNVLIVEDGNDIREVISTTFNKISNHVWDAVDGQEGLSKFKEMKPDVVITDIRMPNMNVMR
jgi:CheY-like chemotaxis protein